jgi:hypothetical protein
VTLILTLVSRRFVLQVSDRMISSGGKALYPGSNKNVIYLARDALVSFGYSGLARLGQTPSDDWIARQITGVSDWGPPPIPWMMQSRVPQWLDIGLAVQHVTRGLTEEFMKAVSPGVRSLPHEVIIAGWQWKWGGSRARPIAWTISRRSDGTFVSESYFPRHHYGSHFFFASTPSSAMQAEQVRKAAAQLGAGAAADHRAAEALLVETIRRVAAQRPGVVGPHCMSIQIYPPRVSVRFVPDPGLTEERSLPAPLDKLGVTFAIGTAPVRDVRQAAPVGGVYAPWMVLGDRFVVSHSFMPVGAGPLSYVCGPFEVVVAGP